MPSRQFFGNGWVAVQLFFVLSGYIMAHNYVPQAQGLGVMMGLEMAHGATQLQLGVQALDRELVSHRGLYLRRFQPHAG